MMNKYDDFQPDLALLTGSYLGDWADPAPRWSRARLYGLGALVRLGLHRRLVYANLSLSWFHEFERYWRVALGNRHLSPQDFYYLAGVYRSRAQGYAPALTSEAAHFEAWRDPRTVYNLFNQVARHALSPLRVHPFTRYIPKRGVVAEYGCGIAPMLTSLHRYYGHLCLTLVGADIPTLPFHYARWKLDRVADMVMIQPGDDAPLALPIWERGWSASSFDVIFCTETFEHLPRPLAVAQHLYRVLKPGGHLVFDYIRSDGTGLDTAAALLERLPTLQFILGHFTIVQGRVTLDGAHVDTTVARKLHHV